MLDFAALPPEVDSGRMYTGPGPGPLLAASEAWDTLAAELGFAATRLRVRAGGADRQRVGGPDVDGDDCRRHAVHQLADLHRHASRADRQPSPRGRRRLRGGFRDDGAATGGSRPTARCWPPWSPPTSSVRTPPRS